MAVSNEPICGLKAPCWFLYEEFIREEHQSKQEEKLEGWWDGVVKMIPAWTSMLAPN